MATWADVEGVALRLPCAFRGSAPDDEPTVEVGPHPFVRRRELDGREVVQLWCWQDAAAACRAEPDRFPRVDVFSVKASVWAWLDVLPADDLAELVAASWRARTGRVPG